MDRVMAVGSGKHLFIDQRYFDRVTGIKLCMNPPYQSPDPVLRPDSPWEAMGICGYNTVICEGKNSFRMWYGAQLIEGLPQEGGIRLCYAESEDGINWHKPRLELVAFQGSKANNIVAPLDERQSMQGATVYLDERASAQERYRLWSKYTPMNAEIAAGIKQGLWAMHSPDGLRWTYDENQPNPVSQKCDTQNVFFWDDLHGRYVGYTRVRETQRRDEAANAWDGGKYRSVGRITSPDFRTWSESTLIVLEGDSVDLGAPLPPKRVARPQMDFYTNAAFKCPEATDVYFMMPAAYHHWEENDNPATMDIKLLSSRDGIIWNYHGEREPFIRRGFDGGPSGGLVMANPWPVETDTETWIYYSGRGHPHNQTDRDGTNSGVFRAVLRRDGFVSADTGLSGGEFTTPPLILTGNTLELNVDCGAAGWLLVELQDAEGRVIPGYGLKDCKTVTANAVRHAVAWTGGDCIDPTGPVRLRVASRATKLYTFHFV